MTDMMLPQVPQAPVSINAAKASPKVAPKVAEDVQESASEQGFSKVLKTQMEAEARPAESAEAAVAATEVPAEAVAQSDNAPQAVADAGKPLPPTGNAGDTLLAVLTGTVATGDTATGETPAASEPATAALSTEATTLSDEVDPLAPSVATSGVPVENRLDAVRGRTERGGATAARPQPAFGAIPGSASRTLGRTTELPPPAQAAVAQVARELPMDTETAQTAPFALERFGAEVRALAGAQPRAAGVDALAERLLAASPQTVPSAQAAQAAATLPTQDATTTARSALPTATLDTPLRQPGWDQTLGERVMWVVNNKFQGVELKLNPAHLGPIEVRVQIQNDQAQVSFVAQHAPVREALEAALPKLREMFGANGFTLADVNVSQQSFAEQQRHARTAAGNFRADTGTEDETDVSAIAQAEFARAGGPPRGAVDLFA